MDAETVATKQFFEENQVPLSNFWLQSCMNWFHAEQNGQPYTPNELYTKVYQQWLLLDLRDVDVPQLPPNLENEKKIALNKTLSLQMMSIIDISRPKLWQLHKIKNSNILTRDVDQDKDSAGIGKRVLQLTLTDGINEIKAVEYKPIPVLNLNLKPGVKIRINGPVTVRRGSMLLLQENIKMLGGEVEEILISHSAENILARCLNLPENPNPKSIEESISVDEAVNMPTNYQRINNNNNYNRNSPIAINNINTNQNAINYDNIRNSTNNQHISDINLNEEEELRIAEEVDMLLEAEHDINVPSFTNKKTPDLFDDEDFNVDNLDEIINEAKEKENKNLKMPQEILEEDDFFTNIDEHLDKIDNQLKAKEETQKVISIKSLLMYCKNKTVGKCKIRGKFKSVVQKLTVISDKWNIKINITDGSNDVAANMHSDLLTDLIGYNPSEIFALKEKVQNKNLEATTTILKAIDGFKDKLIELDNVMEMEFYANEEVPTIISIK